MNKNQKQEPNSKTNMDRVDNDNIFDKWLMALIYVALLLLRKKKDDDTKRWNFQG